MGHAMRRCANAIRGQKCDEAESVDVEAPGLSCKAARARCRRPPVLVLAVILIVVVLAGHAIHDGHKADGNPFVWLFGRLGFSIVLYLHPYYQGRREATDPSPRCCMDDSACIQARAAKQRFAVATTLRTDQYLGLTQGLACSIRRTNGDLPLVVLTVKGDLTEDSENAVREVATLVHVEDFFVRSLHTQRFSYNWLKLRAWELTDFDAVLLLDSDMTVESDLQHIFQLPTEYATVLDVDKLRSFSRFSPLGAAQGGVHFFRPCAAVGQHMMGLIERNYMLQFPLHDAEQHFLDWYFKFTRWTMPQEYNALDGPPHIVTIPNNNHGRNVTIGGSVPVIRHFTGEEKPWQANLEECHRKMAEDAKAAERKDRRLAASRAADAGAAATDPELVT